MKPRTADLAQGKWRGILLALGVDRKYLTGKHGPCPMCAGTDRFRWDNQHGNGGYFCSQCGAGNGFGLLQAIKGWDFPTAAAKVDEIVGNVEREKLRPPLPEDQRRKLLNDLWTGAKPIEQGDYAHAYLAGRGIAPKTMPKCLRFHPLVVGPDGHRRPAMLAMVQDTEGKGKNIHRTFLGPNGKAVMDNPRAMMPGAIPEGGAVRLFPMFGDRLGIAEGIETALAASARFGLPVWSAINSIMLAKWQPPANVREVLIFGDCDAKFGGQAAAYALAYKLATRREPLSVQVHIPGEMGRDWADIAA